MKIEQLSILFGVSLMTIHRDLDELESANLLRKSRGWATASEGETVEPSESFRRGHQTAEKTAIVKAAARLISRGQSMFIDDSTTAAGLAPYLAASVPMTVITNYLKLMHQLAQIDDITLIGIGGAYSGWSNSFTGNAATREIRQLRADLFIGSSSAVVDGLCCNHAAEVVEYKRAMMDSAKERILLIDHTKFEQRALHAMASIEEFDHVVIDSRASSELLAVLRDRASHVVVATIEQT